MATHTLKTTPKLKPDDLDNWDLEDRFVAQFGKLAQLGRGQNLKDFNAAVKASVETGKLHPSLALVDREVRAT